MPIDVGFRLGPYEITGALGAGGMGEVYRARDPRLGRDVAIKVLPSTLSPDAERLRRFEQEARAAAALNHPNILAVHDIGTHEGAPYIVSELLEGETLRERLHGGALPVRKAIEYAVPIAHGLAAAHEKGIVHRDLKPENIFVTSDGRIKILDFGLAKLTEAEVTGANATLLPTTPATLPGVVLGTIGYMAPEQVRGLPTDHRSDIFALGAVLYEMLSGRRAFHGDTAMDAVTAILKEDPPDLPAAERHIPSPLARVVERCLEKSPALRFKSADDLAFALEALSTQSSTAETVVPTVIPPRARVPWIVAGLLGAALAVVVALPYGRPSVVAPETRLEITTPSTADPISFAISPDGRQMVFVASADGAPRLWLRPLAATNAQPLAGTEGASYPFWSPGSRSIGFFDGSKLKRIDIGGGPPQVISDAAARGGAWNAQGDIIFSRTAVGPLFRVAGTSGEVMALTTLQTPGHTSHRFPQFLPDGRHFLFFSQGSLDSRGIYAGSLDAPEIKRLTPADIGGVYLPPDWLLFVRQGILLARHIDLSRTELTGEPIAVADSVGFDGILNVAAVSVSQTGLISYRRGGSGQRQLTWFDRTGKTLGTVGEPDDEGLSTPKISPDGRRVVVYRVAEGNNDIWILDGVRRTRLTFDPSQDRFPIWSSDGSRIFFDSTRRGGRRDLYSKPSNNTGSEQPLLETDLDKVAGDASPDGRFLLFATNAPKLGWDQWVLPLTGDAKPYAFLNASFDERNGQFSPDGKWIAYSSNESGRFEIYARPFPKNDGQTSISTTGGIWPRWAPDGKTLYYVAPDGKLMAVPITINGAAMEAGAPSALFQTHIVGGGTGIDLGRQYDVAPDGRFLINVTADDTAAPITVIENWSKR
jgi:serine/threonine protein kinase/Tol biopolymer transport system component